MALLKVFLNGQFQHSQELEASHEIMVGRGESCDIVLQPERGISRKHFRMRFADGQWVVEVLSRFGELYKNGDKQSVLALQHGTTFTVPPYEFVFEDEAEGVSKASQVSVNKSISRADDDKTHIGYLPSIAFLKLTDSRGNVTQTFRLEGIAWVAGRETNCSIFIDSPKVSRRQFEMQKQDEVFFIRDLGSINVTMLNGRALSGDDWTAMTSSDVITVADWSLTFEVRDASFEQRLQEVDPTLMKPFYNYEEQANSQFGNQQGAFDPYASADAGGVPSQSIPDAHGAQVGMKLLGKHIPWLNPVRLGVIAILFLALVYGVSDHFSSGQSVATKPKSLFEKLTPDKQQTVKQLYATAQSLLAQGRYEMARQEVIKLHQIIPFYEDSKQIEETANHGLAILAEKEKNEADERQRAMTEEKIQRQVVECRQRLNDNATSSWVESCLASVMEFNPEHPLIMALKNQVLQMEQERIIREAQQKEYLEKVAQLRAMYNKAQKIEKDGRPLPAIAAYEKVERSSLPDPNGVKKMAKRQIASLQAEMDLKRATVQDKAEAAYRSGQLKQAIVIIREGMAIDPENEILRGKHLQYMNDLRKQMQNFYQEGILEESVGEVETAKTKWKKIVDQSLPGEDYFEKARLKLKKYGAL